MAIPVVVLETPGSLQAPGFFPQITPRLVWQAGRYAFEARPDPALTLWQLTKEALEVLLTG